MALRTDFDALVSQATRIDRAAEALIDGRGLMSDEEPGTEAQPFELDELLAQLPEQESGRLFGVDIANVTNPLAAPAIRSVLQNAVTDAVKDAVQAEVDEAPDPSVIEELHAHAATAARRAVTVAMAALDEETADEEPKLYYGSVDEFVRECLVMNCRCRIDCQLTVWATGWWNYPEATIRLGALWQAWEHLRLDPTTGMSVWFATTPSTS